MTFCLAGMALPGLIQARTWTQASTGKQIEAEFVKIEGDKALLKVGNRTAQVPIADLSAEDQAYIKSLAAGGEGASGGADWPRWRGPEGNDISPDKGVAGSWPSDGPKKLWVYDKAGIGYSSFIVVGGKLFTLGARDGDVVMICLDTNSGEEVWSTKISEDDGSGYSAGWGTGPRSTPTYSDGKLYGLGPKGTLACVNAADGKKEWDKNLVSDFGGKWGGWGYAESPLVDGDQVVVCPGGKDNGIVALDKNTGATKWKASEVQPGPAEYASLVPVEINGTRQYIRLFQTQLVSVAAEDGKLLWSSDWPGKTAVIPTPIVDGNEIYISSGYGVGCKLVKVGADNTVSDVWVNSVMKNHHGGVVKVGDHLYGFSDGAGLICQDWKSGEMVWNEKGRFTTKGAVHVVDGKLVCLNESDGTVTLAEASPDGFKQLGQFQLEPQSKTRESHKGQIWAHPVVIGGKLYLRDQEFIACYDVKG
ncbi:MAG: PQQ-binding-like beta-propeller repeat protein [Akkermansiaceae bacterium]|nr:PQQ-binding-like beta-propeller repeat protein [Akkermansiaceae bacterium]MCP5550328.1 PQQ-binding-like beta-propeller repeat protein [Akkermansiaceae bacterium]